MKKVIIVSGYFNPLHKGHIEYFQLAKNRGDKLFVIINNDTQRKLKGSQEFQDENERLLIIRNLKIVDKCFLSIDTDRSVSRSIKFLFDKYKTKYTFAFANGGDQSINSTIESKICKELGIQLIDGLGEKIQSSSWLLKKN